MKWVTRDRPKTDRIACPWLIRNFIDPDAEFLYVPADEVLAVAEREGAHSYDAPGAEYTHRDGLCSFEVLIADYGLDDPALALLARIVHGADVADDRDATPESRGLLAVAEGFHLLNLGDYRRLELSLPVYDALSAWCRAQVRSRRSVPERSADVRRPHWCRSDRGTRLRRAQPPARPSRSPWGGRRPRRRGARSALLERSRRRARERLPLLRRAAARSGRRRAPSERPRLRPRAAAPLP